MEIAGVDPFRTGQPRAQARQPQLEFRREADSDKETQHAICPPLGSAPSNKERENTGMAVEAIAGDLAIGEKADQRKFAQTLADQCGLHSGFTEQCGSPRDT